ncbi:choice-of-anchor Q domain-containing protein, partial [Oleiphilus sp. HI0117]
KTNLKFSALISSALLVGLSFTSQAANFAVNDTNDSVDVDPGNGVCATANGSCSLRAAVMEANALQGADAITLPAGTFKISLGEIGEDLAAEGDLDILDDLSITGAGDSLTEISSTNNSYRLVSVLRNEDYVLPTLSISNVTMTEGLAYDKAALIYSEGDLNLDSVVLTNAGPESNAIYIEGMYIGGGNLELTSSQVNSNYRGLYLDGGRASISGTTFRENVSTEEGSAIFQELGIVSIADSSFLNNEASNGGAIKSEGNISIDSSHFEGNVSSGNGGGANLEGQYSSIVNSTFISNQASDGGAVFIGTNEFTNSSVIKDSSFTSNHASDQGGALYTGIGLILVDSSFNSNTAGRFGGAIHSSEMSASNILVANNEAEIAAGGIAMVSGSISNSRIVNNKATHQFSHSGGINAYNEIELSFSEVSGNSAASAGGVGIGHNNAEGSSVIINSTIANNSAELHSGGLYLNDGELEIINSTLVHNALPLDKDTRGTSIDSSKGSVGLRNTLIYTESGFQNCVGNIESLGNNFASDSTCGHNAVIDMLHPSLLADSKLGELKDNGGYTHTIELEPEHPAIDAGDGQYCHSEKMLDQRYYVRADSACDIGAYEVGSRKAIAGTLSFSSANYEVNEDGGFITVKVSRTGGSEGEAVAWVYDTGLGDAKPDSISDYEILKPLALKWSDGDASDKTFEIQVYNEETYFGLDDNNNPVGFLEGDETFTLGMVQTGIAHLGVDETTITIIDIDEANSNIDDDSSNEGDYTSDNSDEPIEDDKGAEQSNGDVNDVEVSSNSSGGGSMSPLFLIALLIILLARLQSQRLF